MALEHYQTAFEPLLYGVGLAIVLTLLLKETGPAVRRRRTPAPAPVRSAMTTRETGTGKYEQLLARCQTLAPVPTAVAHPCEATALAGALEAGAQGLIMPILVGPAAKIAEVAETRRTRPRRARRSSMRRTAMARRPRPSSWFARARPSC